MNKNKSGKTILEEVSEWKNDALQFHKDEKRKESEGQDLSGDEKHNAILCRLIEEGKRLLSIVNTKKVNLEKLNLSPNLINARIHSLEEDMEMLYHPLSREENATVWSIIHPNVRPC